MIREVYNKRWPEKEYRHVIFGNEGERNEVEDTIFIIPKGVDVEREVFSCDFDDKRLLMTMIREAGDEIQCAEKSVTVTKGDGKLTKKESKVFVVPIGLSVEWEKMYKESWEAMEKLVGKLKEKSSTRATLIALNIPEKGVIRKILEVAIRSAKTDIKLYVGTRKSRGTTTERARSKSRVRQQQGAVTVKPGELTFADLVKKVNKTLM